MTPEAVVGSLTALIHAWQQDVNHDRATVGSLTALVHGWWQEDLDHD